MNKRIRTRLLVILGVTVFSVYLFAGFPPSLAKMHDRIHLGLDLRGGMHLVLKVMVDDAIKSERDQAIETVRENLQKGNVTVKQLTASTEVDRFQAIGVDPNKDPDFRHVITDHLPEWDIVATSSEVPNTYTVALKTAEAQDFREKAVDDAILSIRNRIDAMGVGEVNIQKQGGLSSYEVLVQLPGVDDLARVEDIMQQTAFLQLKLVDSGPFANQQAAAQQYNGIIPGNLELLPARERGATSAGESYYVVQRAASVTGRDLKGAFPSRDGNGRPAVSFNLTADGATKFGNITEQNVGKKLAIVLDNIIQSAPVINSRITDSGIIEGGAGGFAPQEAQDLSLVLRSGALPAGITYEDKEVVGPSLGADSVRAGMIAALVALALVVVFMLFYYRLSGVNATVAMILNLVVLFGALAYFGAALTLPGIAGVILTIGVGIDSNVLIFERIREEMRSGKTAVSAVSTSFQRVFITLVDTHLAALISATFLFLFGTGPVKGFAVTLVIGLISNMFTAVFVSRTLFEIVLSRQERADTLSI